MILGTGAAVAAGAVLLLLITAAALALYVGLRERGEARAVRAEQARLAAMIGTAPAVPMVVRADGRIEMPQRLVDWFGLAGEPRFLADLATADAGLRPEDASALASDVVAAQRAGRAFVRAVRPLHSTRAITLRGGRAGLADNSPGSVVIWAFDATASETEIARLEGDVSRYKGAWESLTGLIEAAPMPMWYRGADLALAMVNTAYVRAVEGENAADVVSRGIELIEGSERGGPLAGAATARDTKRPHEQSLPATISGERRALRLIDVPLPGGGVAGFAVDIEDLEQTRAGHKRFAEAFRAMLDRLSAAVVQFGPDRSLVFCNQPFRRMFAMRPEWLAERPDFDRLFERMREAERLPEVRDFPAWRAERRAWFVETDGVAEEQWHLPSGAHLRVVAQPLPEGGLLLIVEDRTEQVQLASARDTLLRVRTATFDNLFEALGVFSADGRVQLWNNRFRGLWALEEEFLAGHPRVDAFADRAAAMLANPAQAALIPELVRAATTERQQRGGRVAFADGRHFEFAAVPLPDGNALFTLLDITDSRRAEEVARERADALEATDRIKTQFVTNMSYELRTPLTSIGGFAEMLHGGYAGALSEQGQAYVVAILDSVERLGLMVDDVLDLTSGEREDGVLERADVDLAKVARAAADTARATAKRRQIDFATEIARSAGRVTGDARRLRETIEHLLRHAIASTRDGGRVLLHLDGTATRARIVVSDDGAGMDPERVALAFDRFAEPGIQPGGERALGLGLPLARQFVEAHGGTIVLVSEPGEGSLITVELPRR